MANEKSSNESGCGLRTVTLTADQWNTLYFYLLTTTKYRNCLLYTSDAADD